MHLTSKLDKLESIYNILSDHQLERYIEMIQLKQLLIKLSHKLMGKDREAIYTIKKIN